MERKFEYIDESIFCHHSIDTEPDPSDFYIHAHERLELLLFISGDASCYVEGSEYVMQPYDVLIMRAAEVHKTHILSQSPYERIAVHFSPTLISAFDKDGLLLRPFLERPLGRLNHYSGSEVQSRFLKSSLESLTPGVAGERARMRVATALMALLSEISEVFENRSDTGQPKDEGTAAQIIEYINANLFGEISLSGISRSFYLSQSQLNRIFGKATGSSIWEYVRLKRLMAAREKILAGERATDACALCGFRDYSSFYRAYKMRFGHAPSEERERTTAEVKDTD